MRPRARRQAQAAANPSASAPAAGAGRSAPRSDCTCWAKGTRCSVAAAANSVRR